MIATENKQIINLLDDLYSKTRDGIEYTDRERFEDDHLEYIEVINHLRHNNHIIRAHYNTYNYRLSIAGLYLVDSHATRKLLSNIDDILSHFLQHYKDHFSKGELLIDELSTVVNQSKTNIKECLNYIQPMGVLGVDATQIDIDDKQSYLTITSSIRRIENVRNTTNYANHILDTYHPELKNVVTTVIEGLGTAPEIRRNKLKLFVDDVVKKSKNKGYDKNGNGNGIKRDGLPPPKKYFQRVFEKEYPKLEKVSLATFEDDLKAIGVKFKHGGQSQRFEDYVIAEWYL